MYPFISVLVVLVSIFLVLIVLVQNSKGGGLASNFSSSNQMMGVRKTTDFLEKATWTLAASLMVLSFVAVMVIRPAQEEGATGIESELNTQMPVQSTPGFDVPEVPADNSTDSAQGN